MKKTILFSVLAALCLFSSASAQSPNTLKPLKTGDQVPDIRLNLLHYRDAKNRPAASARPSDFKGKLVLLDFWASWCSNCIEAMPRVKQLEQRHQSEMQVLGVNEESKEKATQFFQRRKKQGQPPDFPTVYGDTLLRQLFPHLSIPHYVWIDRDGRYITATSAEEVNEANLQKALNHRAQEITVKKDIDPGQPLFLQQDFPMDSLFHYSVLFKFYYPGLGTSARERKTNGQVTGQACTNYSLLHLYQFLAAKFFQRGGEHFTPKRMLLETRDSGKLVKEDEQVRNTGPAQKPAYNYDLIVPVAKKDSLYEIMLADLNRYSGYEGRTEQRPVRCLALQRTAAYRDLTSKGGEPLTLVLDGRPGRQQNQPVKNLVARLNEAGTIRLPIVDETDITGKVDLRFSGATDLASINAELLQQGLILTEKIKILTVFILRDPNPTPYPMIHEK